MSETLDLFKAALGLGEQWRVTRSDFDVEQCRLDLYHVAAPTQVPSVSVPGGILMSRPGEKSMSGIPTNVHYALTYSNPIRAPRQAS